MEAVNPDRSYTAPPIIEAVIDLQFVDPLKEGELRKLTKKLKRYYSNELEGTAVTAHVDIVSKATTYVDTPLFRLSSEDETDLIIVSLPKLTWAKLAPYAGWSEFIARFQRDFEIMHDISGPRPLSRIGLRYINRIDVPSSSGLTNYEDYLKINLNLPSFLDPISSYGWRIEKVFPDTHLIAIVQSTVVASEVPGTLPFLLDIDIVAQTKLPVKIPDIIGKLSAMRALKNTIFEVSISDKARERFEQ
jgi:uncharacterized protein (TIGR04255 family)